MLALHRLTRAVASMLPSMRPLLACIAIALATVDGITYIGNASSSPSSAQLSWQAYEVGVMITYNLQTFCIPPTDRYASKQRCQEYDLSVPNWTAVQSLEMAALDTDAWLAAAASFGARYAVLVADHMTGFTLWPTKAHNLSIAATRFRGGQGDVVAEFRSSCARRGVAPGLFYSTHFNWFLGVNEYAVGWPRMYGGEALTQAAYEDIVLAQLAELQAYEHDSTGLPWAEVWFDGGVNNSATPRVGAAVRSLFPTAVCHSCFGFTQSGPGGVANGYGLRWMGNEEGSMPLPSWGASDATGLPFNGDPGGPLFIPPSSDTVLAEHYWFWLPGYGDHLRSTCALVSVYLTTVGRSANLILNMAPNTTGGVDPGDVTAYAAMGEAIQCLWEQPLGEATGLMLDAGGVVVIPWPTPFAVPPAAAAAPLPLAVQLQEDLAATGQRIVAWALDACVSPDAGDGDCVQGAWVPLGGAGGTGGSLPPNATTGIGHKRILQADLAAPPPLSLQATTSAWLSALRFSALTAYAWETLPSAPLRLARVALYNWTHATQGGACVPADCQLPRF